MAPVTRIASFATDGNPGRINGYPQRRFDAAAASAAAVITASAVFTKMRLSKNNFTRKKEN
jgi:hypothetical protein